MDAEVLECQAAFGAVMQDLLTANLISRVIDNKYNNLREKNRMWLVRFSNFPSIFV